MKKIYCIKCVYYFVTWDPSAPHGCKAFGFKSKMIPSMEVRKNSGKDCQYFELKNPTTSAK